MPSNGGRARRWTALSLVTGALLAVPAVAVAAPGQHDGGAVPGGTRVTGGSASIGGSDHGGVAQGGTGVTLPRRPYPWDSHGIRPDGSHWNG